MNEGKIIFDYMGRKFEIIDEDVVEEFSGDGGIYAFARTDVSIKVNDYLIEFAMKVKVPALLYINGIPCNRGIMYGTVEADDGYWYGFYFDQLEYEEKVVNADPILVRKMKGMVAKCLPKFPWL